MAITLTIQTPSSTALYVANVVEESEDMARFSSRRKTDNPFLQAKGSERNYFSAMSGLQRFSAGLPFANRMYWWQSDSEIKKGIPDEMHTIGRITRLERCEPDKNTGFRWRFA
jgi:hypothetical protein